MNEQTVVGTGREVAGTVEFKLGDAVGREDIKADGLIDKAGGLLQHGYGTARDLASDTVNEVPAVADAVVDRGREWGQRADTAIRERLGDRGPLYVLAGVIGVLGLGAFAYAWSGRGGAQRRRRTPSGSRRTGSSRSSKPRRKPTAA